MEEDIKILEELTEEYNSQHYMDIPLINGKQIQALENLIKGYKLEKLKNVLDEQSLKETLEEYIPKSKIKEYIDKIQEELDKRKVKGMYIALEGDITDDDINTWIIQRATLQELMEDK